MLYCIILSKYSIGEIMDTVYFDIMGKYPIKCKMFSPDSGEVSSVVLCVHGFAGDKESSMIFQLGQAFTQFNGVVVSFDFPAHGESLQDEAYLTTDNCRFDLCAVANWINAQYPEANKFIFATSFGGFISLLEAESFENYKYILRAPAVTMPKVLLENVLHLSSEEFCRLGSIKCGFERPIQLPYSFYTDISKYSFDNCTFYQPMLVIHGDKDNVVPYTDIVEFCRTHSNTTLVTICGVDHRFKHPCEFEMIVSETARFMGVNNQE